jgi:ankyrin repeat protein
MGSLKHAISVCKLEDVRKLLNEGFDITSTDYDGRTILHLAAIAGDVKIVEMLVNDFDAVISATDR